MHFSGFLVNQNYIKINRMSQSAHWYIKVLQVEWVSSTLLNPQNAAIKPGRRHRVAIWRLKVNSTRHNGADQNFRWHWTRSELTSFPNCSSQSGLNRTPSLEVVNGINRESFRRSPQIPARRTEKGFPDTQRNWEITFLFSTLSCPSLQIIQWWQQGGIAGA